ncbi:MAG TPA: LCP family protein [Lachnospiraceae bacterium]|nr:LCP family protein [Lachnospiraceae bacterium]
MAKKEKKQLTPREKAKKKRKNIIFFVIEIFILLIMLIVLWGVLKVEKSEIITFEDGDIIASEEIKDMIQDENSAMNGYRNIALFGVDSRENGLNKNTRTDTIIIASINEDTKEVKLVSVYRDTYLNMTNGTYNKSNAAYFQGGPKQAINMLNMNLDIYIKDYITVGFKGLIDTIDALGGIMIDVDSSEISHLNNYQSTMADDLKRSYTKVTDTGYQLLNGLQATGYCRIRYTLGDDFKRAERQREVLMAVAEKAKKASPATLSKIADEVFKNVSTSLKLDEILSLLVAIGDYTITDNAGFPETNMRTTGTIGKAGSCVIPISLESNVVWLHQFLYGDDNYKVTSNVSEYSSKVYKDTSPYLK